MTSNNVKKNNIRSHSDDGNISVPNGVHDSGRENSAGAADGATSTSLNHQHPFQKYHTKEDIILKHVIMERVRSHRVEGQVYFKGSFDLMYVGFLGYLPNRKTVASDLKDLEAMLESCSIKMEEIYKKSKGSARTASG